jgi:putative RecB family exonuclease
VSAPVQGSFSGMPEPLYTASPSRLLAWLDCPRRYRMAYLDRPRPTPAPQRAHTTIGIVVHTALREWWDQPRRTPAAGADLITRHWSDTGFRDAAQSAHWRARTGGEVAAYLVAAPGIDPGRLPLGVERPAAFKTRELALAGRLDRLDDRAGELVVVDYKTGRRPPTVQDAHTSLPLALYAAAVWKMFRRRCLRVELHHVPTATVVAHEHSPESLTRKVREAESIAADLRRADARYAAHGPGPEAAACFAPRVSPLCQWCDYRAHCREGQTAGPAKSPWAALEGLAEPEEIGGEQDERVTDVEHFGGDGASDDSGALDSRAVDSGAVESLALDRRAVEGLGEADGPLAPGGP